MFEVARNNTNEILMIKRYHGEEKKVEIKNFEAGCLDEMKKNLHQRDSLVIYVIPELKGLNERLDRDLAEAILLNVSYWYISTSANRHFMKEYLIKNADVVWEVIKKHPYEYWLTNRSQDKLYAIFANRVRQEYQTVEGVLQWFPNDCKKKHYNSREKRKKEVEKIPESLKTQDVAMYLFKNGLNLLDCFLDEKEELTDDFVRDFVMNGGRFGELNGSQNLRLFDSAALDDSRVAMKLIANSGHCIAVQESLKALKKHKPFLVTYENVKELYESDISLLSELIDNDWVSTEWVIKLMSLSWRGITHLSSKYSDMLSPEQLDSMKLAALIQLEEELM